MGFKNMLTGKELEIMDILWRNGAPMTCSEIIEASEATRSWKTSSVFVILRTMIKKGYVNIADFKPTQTRNAKTYAAALSREEYAAVQSGKLDVDSSAFLLAFVKQQHLDKEKTKMLLRDIYEKLDFKD